SAAMFIVACGRPAPPPAMPSALSTPTPAVAAIARNLPPLEIVLEGDAIRRSDTEYEAAGPEILCSAFLMDSEVPRLVSSEVEWKTDPPGGSFSSGASGVFFLPDSHSTVKIYALFSEQGQVSPGASSPSMAGYTVESPRITLIVP
ncbi:MAG: hypothetical protein AAB229_02220, partial [Candidatus Hydrogenedentota bacterium]